MNAVQEITAEIRNCLVPILCAEGASDREARELQVAAKRIVDLCARLDKTARDCR